MNQYLIILNEYFLTALPLAQRAGTTRTEKIAAIVAVQKLRDELTKRHGREIPIEALETMRDFMARYQDSTD